MHGTDVDTEVEPTAESVTIYLDESAVHTCRIHPNCPNDGVAQPGPDCKRLYFYGVGASVLENNFDHRNLTVRLDRLRALLEVRNGMALARRAKKFARDGWHSTDDPIEYSDPLLFELDLGGNFKGHVRYSVSNSRVDGDELAKLYRRLFVRLLADLLRRYEREDRLNVEFEADGRAAGENLRIVAEAGGDPARTIVSTRGKGDSLLAVADYLLFATMRYIARNEQLCIDHPCEVDHRVPTGDRLRFDSNGNLEASGHVGKDDRWHKQYFCFVRNMSSVVSVAHLK